LAALTVLLVFCHMVCPRYLIANVRFFEATSCFAMYDMVHSFIPLEFCDLCAGNRVYVVHNRVRLDRPLILKLSLLSVLMAPLLLAEDARAVMVSFDARSSRLARRKVWTKSKSRQRNGAECAGCELPWISRNMTFVAHSRPPHPVNWRRAAAR
jgi:hypothetical protein